MKKILIAGTGSHMNYGCEAIVRGTYKLIKENIIDADVTVASDNVDEDEKIFQDIPDLKFISIRNRYSLYRIFMGILRRLKLSQGSPVRMKVNLVKQFDIFFSCGGDNFAEAPDGTIYHLLEDLMQMGAIAKKCGKKYFIWGASIGPFNELNLKVVKKNLQLADGIFVREELSYAYLKKIGLGNNYHLISDPAFQMKLPHRQKDSNESFIGINISLLSIKHVFDDEKIGKQKLFDAIDNLIENNSDYTFKLIPHVMTTKGGSQDDNEILNEFYNYSKYKSRLIKLPNGLGALKTKKEIQQCEILLAARMHCGVAGISAGVPTIFISYSIKGEGMTKYAYDDLDMRIDLKTINEKSFSDKVEYINNKYDIIIEKLLTKQKSFLKDSEKGIFYIKDCI